jgi:DNA-binding MarR family transcriptional regulator
MPRWLTETEQKAWRTLIGSTYRLLARLDHELQSAHGLSLGEYEVLAILSESPERRRRMADLACSLHVSPSGMTRRVDGLVRRGLVERAVCPEDRRGSLAVLTDDGMALVRRAAPTHVRGVREHLIDRLSERQLANLAAALERID